MLGVRGVLRFVAVVAGVVVLAAAGGSSDAAAGPSVPTITSVTVTATTATLTWKASTGVGAMLYNVDLDYAYQKTVHGATSWTLTGLACSTVYTFQVQAIDHDWRSVNRRPRLASPDAAPLRGLVGLWFPRRVSFLAGTSIRPQPGHNAA